MKLLQSNEWQYRLLRTVLQGIIGVIVANLDMLIDRLSFDPAIKTMIVAICMAILSPIMAEIGARNEKPGDDQDDDYFIISGDGSGRKL